MESFFERKHPVENYIAAERITPISYFGQRETIVLDLFSLFGNKQYQCFYDPFAGSGSISFEAMKRSFAQDYIINDSFPVLMYLWEFIKSHPQELIKKYSLYVNVYCVQSKENRSYFYNELLEEFNRAYSQGFNAKAAILFVFLINYADKNMPYFDEGHLLKCQPNVFINKSLEEKQIIEFRQRTIYLSELFGRYRVKFTSGDFLQCVETAAKGDAIVLDPPYPSQASNIYFKLKEERELYENLKLVFKQLNERGVDYLALYGARAVALSNQFDEEECHVHHLVRLSTHSIFGHFIDHIYVSRSIPLTNEQLPKGMAFYHSLFRKNEEILDAEYERAIVTLKGGGIGLQKNEFEKLLEPVVIAKL